jgi:DNA-binding NtrC family response regulator
VREAYQGPGGAPAGGAPAAIAQPRPAGPAEPVPDPIVADRPSLDELNRRYAHRTLREMGGNKTRAAEALGIDRKTLSRLIGPEE